MRRRSRRRTIRTRATGRSTRISSAARQGGATLQVEARDSSGQPMSGLEISGPLRAADRPARRSAGRRSPKPASASIAATRDAIAPGQWDLVLEGDRGGTAHVPVAEPRAVELGRIRPCRRRATFHIMSRTLGAGLSHIDLAVEGVSCAGCMSKIERGLSAIPDVTLARVNLTDRRVALEWKQGALDPARFIDRLAELGYKAYPFETGPRRSDGSRAGALPAALPRRRRLRHHERDDAVGPGMVRQCQRHAPGAARFLPLAVGADRAAGGGLCRPAVLPLGLARAARAQHQHGRADQRSASCWRSACRVVETIHHAEHAYFDAAIMLLTFLLVGRYLDQNMRRRTRAVAGNLAALKAETATKFVGADEISRGAGRGDPARRHRAAAARRALRRRRHRDRGTVRDRPEPDHRRDPACAAAEQGTRGLCGLAQYLRHAAGAGLGGVRRHAAGRDHAAARQRAAGALALCATGRSRLAALRAGGACDRAADHARLGSGGRELARCHRHRRSRF